MSGDGAKKLSEIFGKIVKDRESLSINSGDTSLSNPPRLIRRFRPVKSLLYLPGRFVGMVADNPDQQMEFKMFNTDIINDHAAIKAEEEDYVPLPKIRSVSTEDIDENYKKIKSDIQNLITTELDKIVANLPENRTSAKPVEEAKPKATSSSKRKTSSGLKKSKSREEKFVLVGLQNQFTIYLYFS